MLVLLHHLHVALYSTLSDLSHPRCLLCFAAEAHPEIAARVATESGAGDAADADHVAVAVGGAEAEDWANGAAKNSGKAAKSSGGGFFSGFGLGRKKDIPVASPASGVDSAVGASAAYVPPSIPAAEADVQASAAYSAAAGMPTYVPPAAGAGGSSTGGAGAGSAGGAFAIEGEDDNPFAAAGGANPYAGR